MHRNVLKINLYIACIRYYLPAESLKFFTPA